MKTFEFTPILGWSSSRFDTFEICKRKYYYQYYAKFDTDFDYNKIDQLKRMTSIPLEIGNIVHDVIKVLLERLLKSEKGIDVNRLFDFTQRKTFSYCSQKQFSEVYYQQIPQVNPSELFSKVKLYLNNLLQSERFNWIITEAVREKNGWIIEPPGYGETRLNNLKAYCKVDFLFPYQNTFVILDWKTGKINTQKYKKQLLGYTAWAAFHFDFDPELIDAYIVQLNPQYEEIHFKYNEFDIEEFSSQMKEETLKMYNYCLDINENIPKEKELFKKTPYKKICNWCNYRELCSLK